LQVHGNGYNAEFYKALHTYAINKLEKEQAAFVAPSHITMKALNLFSVVLLFSTLVFASTVPQSKIPTLTKKLNLSFCFLVEG